MKRGAWKARLEEILHDYGPALVRNIVTPASFLIFTLAIVLLFMGQKGDALFLISTIVLNSLIAIFQEIKAIKTLKNLTLLNADTARKVTKNGIKTISLEDIETGDFLEINYGDQVPADGIITETDNLEIDESMLTGESVEIEKQINNSVFAGSSVVAGRAVMKVTACGKHTRVSQMEARLSWYEQKFTPLQGVLMSMIRIFTYVALILSIIIFIDSRVSGLNLTDTINTIVAGALSLVPEGLLLAGTLLFSYGSVNMASAGVLVQRISAIEGFGRLKTLCTDKTGTLTESLPRFKQIFTLHHQRVEDLEKYLSIFTEASQAKNPTLLAISEAIGVVKHEDLELIDSLAFSSSRKYSAIRVKEHSHVATIAIGAPEILSKTAYISPANYKKIEAQMQAGHRVLLIAKYDFKDEEIDDTIEKRVGTSIGYITFTARLRPNVQDSVFYLQAQGVDIKIITGDSAITASAVARQAGILNPDKVLTGDQIAMLDEKQLSEALKTYSIFARVLPEQKEKLIKMSSLHGFTGMVGDGVNDALALKSADLSVAMASGNQAARKVSDIVLINNTFEAFPQGMKLGNQIILGIELVTALFLNKIIFSTIIVLQNIFFSLPYPFLAKHILLLNIFIIGLPTLIWSLVPPKAAGRKSIENFFKKLIPFSLINGTIFGLAVTAGFLTAWLTSFDLSIARTAALIITLFLGMWVFRLIPRALGAVDNHALRSWQVFYLCLAPILFVLLQYTKAVDIFNLSRLSWQQALIALCIILSAGGAQERLTRYGKKLRPFVA